MQWGDFRLIFFLSFISVVVQFCVAQQPNPLTSSENTRTFCEEVGRAANQKGDLTLASMKMVS